MDATANDVSNNKYKASGFPTMMYATTNAKENPISYDGGREVEDMAKFIKEKATVSLEVCAPPPCSPRPPHLLKAISQQQEEL